MSEEKIKAIIRSNGWSDYRVEPFKANTFEEKLSMDSYMWQIIENGGQLFVKEIIGERQSGSVSIISENPQVLEPMLIPYRHTIVVGVGQAPFGRMFNVFIRRDFFGEEEFETIYFSDDLKYVDASIEKILREVVKPEYYRELITVERFYNDGVVNSMPRMKFPTIDSGNIQQPK